MRKLLNFRLTVSSIGNSGNSSSTVLAEFYANDREDAQVISRAFFRKWNASAKKFGGEPLTKDMVRLSRIKS